MTRSQNKNVVDFAVGVSHLICMACFLFLVYTSTLKQKKDELRHYKPAHIWVPH